MEKRTLLLAGIPIAGLLVVANLLFFWLAPDVGCKLLVYGFSMGVILIQGVTSGVLWHCFGAQKATPMVVSGTSFALGILVAGGIMLALEAPFQTALYFLIIFSVLYLICAGYLSCIAADELWERVENAVIDPPSAHHPIRDWLRAMRTTFSRRRPGESDAERHVRNNREVNPEPVPDPVPVQSGPPPLPGRQI